MELSDLLLALRREINKSVKGNTFGQQLTLPQLQSLWFIYLSGKRTMDSIANYLHITPPSATALIERMAKKGWVKRERHLTDRRIVEVVLTAKTKREVEGMRNEMNRALKKIVSKLSAKDRKEFTRIMKLLVSK